MPWSNISSNSRMYMTYFSYMAFDQRVKWYFTDLKAIFRWIRILILYISNISILPLDLPLLLPNHISKISISFRPPPPLTCLYNTCTLPNHDNSCHWQDMSLMFIASKRIYYTGLTMTILVTDKFCHWLFLSNRQ